MWKRALTTAPDVVDEDWFVTLAEPLLHRTVLLVGGRPHRFREVEFYYYGGAHLDPFAHRDPLQLTGGRWYFHREGGGYRGGSFKGLDISFGPEDAYGGILIRTLETPDGEEINGCSLCVDHLLALCGAPTVADLDHTIDARRVWDESSPLHLRPVEQEEPRPVVATARVGLTLKRADQHPAMPAYVMKPYRFLTDPTIKKGKLHTVVALLQEGLSDEDIRARTNSSSRTIASIRERWSEGQRLDSFAPFVGRSLKSADLATLHGVWERYYGPCGEGVS